MALSSSTVLNEMSRAERHHPRKEEGHTYTVEMVIEECYI